MPNLSYEILDCVRAGIIFSLTFYVFKKLLDQNDDIEEMFSRLEDCEEKLSQCEENHELKK